MSNNKPRIIASIEARMGSSRLPGKVLMNIFGQKSLNRLVDRLKQSQYITDIVLATSTAAADDVLEEWANSEKIALYRGSENDVLNRVVKAQQMMASDIVVEVTGDCPLIDPKLIDLGISTFIANHYDVVSNTFQSSYPMGLDVQVFKLSSLEWVEQNIMDPPVREHVSLYFYENPDKYQICHLEAPPEHYYPSLRCMLDYPEDLDFLNKVYEKLEPVYGLNFGVDEILKLLRSNPEIAKINASCKKKSIR